MQHNTFVGISLESIGLSTSVEIKHIDCRPSREACTNSDPAVAAEQQTIIVVERTGLNAENWRPLARRRAKVDMVKVGGASDRCEISVSRNGHRGDPRRNLYSTNNNH